MAGSDRAGSGGGGDSERKARVLIGTPRLPSKLPSRLRVNGVNSVNTSGLSVSKHAVE